MDAVGMLKTLIAKLKSWNEYLTVGSFYSFVALSDWITSLLNNSNPAVYESNPFVSDRLGRFVLLKGLIVDGMLLIVLLLIARVVYITLYRCNRDLARGIALLIFIYVAADRLLTAVFGNVLFLLKFYQPDVIDLLERMLAP